jgi:pectin methylesterase-like acyl-CoA thioesterase
MMMGSAVLKSLRLACGAVFCLFAFPSTTQGAQTINVDMDHGAIYTGTAAAPDTGTKWNSISAAGTLSPVLDSQGNTVSGVAIAFSSSGTVHIYNDTAAGNPNPSALMSDYTYGATYTLTITGLTPNQAYGLYAYSHGNVDNQTGTITLAAANGGAGASTSQTGDSSNFRNIYMYGKGYDYVVLSGTADGSGALTFTVVNYLNGFQLQKLVAPTITGLTNQTVIAGTSTALDPTITGTPAPGLQWRSNSVPLVGQTNASLALNNVQYVQNNSVYSLIASNAVGAITNSMTLSVIVTPGITGLNSQAVPVGANVTNTANISGAPSPATRWQFNGNNLSDGATGNGSTISGSASGTLIIVYAQAADSGTYSLVASNSAGIVTNSMTLTVSAGDVPPSITGLSDQAVVQTSDAIFAASVSGLPVPTLRWRVNGTNITGANASSLTVSNVQYSQNAFVYSLVASNNAGQATNSATLFVLVPPLISQQPTNLTVVVGLPVTFSVAASGVPTVKYQWTRNGNPISNATNSSYSISSAQGSDNGGVFSVIASNTVGTIISSNAMLTVLSAMSGAFLPTNNATGISPDQQLRIVFSSAPKIGSGKLYVRDASNDSIFAAIDTSLFQTITLFGATVTNNYTRVVQGGTYFYMPMAIYGEEAWITFSNRLAYNKTYYVNADAGLFLDSSNAAFPAITGPNAWRFSTKASGPAAPTTSTGPTNLTVGIDGTGDFATVQGAADWVPQNNVLKRTFTILPGIYRDYVVVQQSRNSINFVGAGTNRQDVQIVYLYPSGPSAATFTITASDIYVRNLTIDNQVYLTNNGVVFAGPINSVFTAGNRIIFDNVLLKGGQDTLYANSGTAYYYRSEIWGSTDFIYGDQLGVFDQCDIIEIRNTGGPVTAPSTPYAQPYGLVFLNCNFPRALIANGYPYDAGTATTTFMRPWRQDGMTALINCALGSQITTKGWSEWDGRETTCRAREYGSTLIAGGSAPTSAQRQAAGAYWLNTADPDYTSSSMNPTNTLLFGSPGVDNRTNVAVNAADFTLSAIFGNAYYNLGSWMPSTIPTITSQPTNTTANAGSAASFSASAFGQPAPVYQWRRNGTNISGATNSILAIGSTRLVDNGIYSVIVSNSAGVVTSSNASLAIPAEPTSITSSMANGGLNFSWPASQTGYRLIGQTNPPGAGLTTNWQPVVNSNTTNQITIPINPGSGSVFFRLVYP